MAVARIAFLAISMVLLSSVTVATDYNVGDDKGWTVDFNYTEWAQDKVFHVGDNLWFNYDNTKHNVLKVNGSAFKDCITTGANGVLTSGKDRVELATPGRKWYICGFADHCSARQMKLVLDVAADEPAPAPAPFPNVAPVPIAAPSTNAAPSLMVSSSLSGVIVAVVNAMVAVAVIFA